MYTWTTWPIGNSNSREPWSLRNEKKGISNKLTWLRHEWMESERRWYRDEGPVKCGVGRQYRVSASKANNYSVWAAQSTGFFTRWQQNHSLNSGNSQVKWNSLSCPFKLFEKRTIKTITNLKHWNLCLFFDELNIIEIFAINPWTVQWFCSHYQLKYLATKSMLLESKCGKMIIVLLMKQEKLKTECCLASKTLHLWVYACRHLVTD